MQRVSRLTSLSSVAGLVLLLASSAPLLEASAYTRAQRLREALDGRPIATRTSFDYEHVIDAYRAVYRGDPRNPEADAAIQAVAGLLSQQGRLFHSQTRLLDAVGQYEFLRLQYPASSYCPGALLSEGEIWQHDLHDPARARATYLEFLRLYPRSDFAAEARADLRSLQPAQFARDRSPAPAHGVEAPVSEFRSASPGEPLPLVTGIRHWSTAIYTRVAIDLQQEVRYETVRVPHPDRIYFDLYGARLSPQLVSRPDDLTDDGFLRSIRAAQLSPDVVRIVLNVSSLSEYSAFFLPNPPRLIIDVHGRKGAPPPAVRVARAEPPIPPRRQVPAETPRRAWNNSGGIVSRNVETGVFPDANADVDTLSHQPDQVRATPYPTTAPVVAAVAGTTPAIQPRRWNRTARTSEPGPTPQPVQNAAGETLRPQSGVPASMVRTLGLKINRIVIDPGHGGHDSGAIGVGGIEEKNVVLDVALRLGRLLHDRLGSDVVYTRRTDTFIPLETRTAIANQDQADLFISIHANSSSDPAVRGVETYYLNFTTSADALQVAARENSVSDESIHQLSSLVRKIALQSKIDESREFAADVDQSLFSGLEKGNSGLENRGVKKAPFVVLIGANMPSILVEISFLTNPTSAEDLRQSAYRERIAEALYCGVAQYVDSLNGERVAQAGTRPSPSE